MSWEPRGQDAHLFVHFRNLLEAPPSLRLTAWCYSLGWVLETRAHLPDKINEKRKT